MVEPADQGWQRLRSVVAGRPLPAALVDLQALARNAAVLMKPLHATGKRVRVASKSVRCLGLLARIKDLCGDRFGGLMTYSARETEWLAHQGFTDLLLAYPVARAVDADALVRANRHGAHAAVVVDCVEHLDLLQAAAHRGGVTLPVVVDVDASTRLAGGRVHLGVRRSPVHEVGAVVALSQLISRTPGLRFHGVQAYEAQIAGLADRDTHQRVQHAAKRAIKLMSRPRVEDLRRMIAEALQRAGLPVPLFNGGGTGSLWWCAQESALTEVTIGSGFVCSHLFDRYRDFHLEPALCFALEVVRRPHAGMVTCLGGGYVASGEAGADRLPQPWWPAGLRLLPMEGAGEVQTPLRVPDGVSLALGDPVFFRHAKAGELAEHFQHYLAVDDTRVMAEWPTYRGQGQCFLG